MFSIDYLLSISGKRTVPIEIGSKYTEADWSQKLMTLKEFIDKFIINGQSLGYLAQHPLFDQVCLRFTQTKFGFNFFINFYKDTRA